MRIPLGASAFIELKFFDRANEPMAATGVALRALSPSGVAASVTPTPGTGVGVFVAEFLPDAPGIWLLRAHCDGPQRAIVRGELHVTGDDFPAV